MLTAVTSEQMAKKRARTETTVRVAAEVATTLKEVATLKGMSINEYIAANLLPIAERDLQAELLKRAKPKR